MDSSIVIDVGDMFERQLSNGAIEQYKVLEPKFYEKFARMEAHYQLKVTRVGLKDRTSSSITYNLNGPNSRVNNSSSDSSNNIVNNGSDELIGLIDSLRKEICLLKTDTQEMEESLEVVDIVETQLESQKPSKKVITTLLNSLPQTVAITKSVARIVESLQDVGVL